ncbi:MAG: hypothetical protein HKN76_15095 [Saprospiraceae bacterium]|nr:hypothetical protein [Saprospiraceae bacterium]
MLRSIATLLLFIVFYFIFSGCSKENANVDCSSENLSFTLSIVDSDCGLASGAISVVPDPGADIVRYRLNEEPYTSSGNFSDLKPGLYLISVENEDGCSIAKEVLIRSGISFKESVRPIILKSCAISGCHDGVGNVDYRVFSNFNPADMKARTQSRNMPKEGTLTQEEIDAIACWVDDGALNN